MLKKFIIKKANIKDLKKLNQFHNNYYKTNRTIKQFLWLFRKTSKFYDFYYALNGKKIVGTLGFIKFNFVYNKKIYKVIKPEDLLISPNARKKNIFEQINKIYEKTILNLKGISININAVAKIFQRANYGTYFGDRKIFIKYHKINSLVDLMNKKRIPRLFSYFFSYLVISYIRIFGSIKKKQIKKNLTYIDFKKSPKWSNNLNKKFLRHWNFFTTDRTKDFLQWRVFNNPYLKEKFTAFYFNKIPVGYVIYNINMKNLYVVDLVVVPINNTIGTKMILNEMLLFLDDHCINRRLNYCKFELYLNSNLNNLLKKSLSKFGYIGKKIDTNFSFKVFNKSVSKKVITQSYITNINKSGKIY